jgi:uncharacterized protein YqeY
MISNKLNEDMKTALKAGDKVKLGVIRMLRSELKNASIAAGGELSDEQEQKVLASYAKKRKEAQDEYAKAGRDDLAAKEYEEYKLTMSYLPAQLDEAELGAIVKAKIEETGAQGPADFGRVMKAVMAEVGSRSDGSAVSAVVKRILAG